MATATAEQRAIATCSFCTKPSTEVRKLIAGPGVYICNQCVDLCVQIIEGEDSAAPGKESDAPPRRLWERFENLDQVLEALPKFAAAGAQAEENLTQLVHRARELGATWAKVGETLGMTRQSAWGRFSGEE